MSGAVAMLSNLFRATPKKPAREPKVHDYTQCFWGHNVTIISVIDGGQQLHVCGHGYDPRAGRRVEQGDYLLLSAPNTPNGSTRYQVASLSNYSDPPDMWAADLTFAPRSVQA